jgi:lipid-A-disaccharide synthase
MIVAGESSGELYGSLLARELKKAWPDIGLMGAGGRRMKEAGVEVFSGVTGALGLTEALHAYRAFKETFRKTVRILKEDPPDVVVLIDYPEFNLRLAAEAKKLGIKVLYYVSPQVWAWRRGRVKTLAEVSDGIAVVLPFEAESFRDSGLHCEFVGHPIMDDIESFPAGKDKSKEALGLEDRPYVALLPGSRGNELKRLLPVIGGMVRMFKEKYPDHGLVMPLAPNIDRGAYREHFDGLEREGVMITDKSAVLALSASEAAVIASGTATLQATFLETPTVVIYRVFPLTYYVAKIVLNVDYIAITNLILNKPALPELIQGRANPEEIMKELGSLLSVGERRDRMIEDLRAVKGLYDGKRPSKRVAEMVGEMSGWTA